MSVHIIGARGRLGQALAAEYAADGVNLLEGTLYRQWARAGGADEVARHFDGHDPETTVLFVASGLLDPASSPEALHAVNFHLPTNLIDGAAKHGIRVITFGTVMERLISSPNPYVESKIALARHVSALAAAGAPVAHIQIHTLYGIGAPSPFMFLGQILASLRSDSPFRMTSGQQLREYHHLVDEARAIRALVATSGTGVLALSHGAPVRLIDIAQALFDAFDKRKLLMAGALPEPREENYEQTLTSSLIGLPVGFRETLPAIIQYMKECYSSPCA